MRKILIFFLSVWLLMPDNEVFGQVQEADSMDVLHYNLILDMGNKVDKQLRATAEITFRVTRPCESLTLDLICDSLSPVSLDGVMTRGFSYDRDNARLSFYLPGGCVGDTHVLTVPYVTNGYTESYGFGGLHIDNDIYYNLGAAIDASPHVFGRSCYPCRDNFYDKATYRLQVTSKPGWRAICSGRRQSESVNSDGSNTSVWVVEQPIPTYILGFSSANWSIIEREYEGLYGRYPALIGFTTQDSGRVSATYDILEDVIPMLEHDFGPYRWGRIGYIATPVGSMEHAQNIALTDACVGTLTEECQMTLCHELGHAWFGNLLTCATSGDMWINEGGATFCEEIATEAAFGRSAAIDYYLRKMDRVLRTAHVTDRSYLALSEMSEQYTYGSTTYQKGALVWHSLRGIMGDSLFYSCMNRLFESCAFGNIEAIALRDSLSLYSGMDLTGFFDFHVFTPGFVDYAIDNLEVEGQNATLTLRQQLRGTDHYAFGNRVPVSFFSYDLQRSDQWMMFDDSIASQTFALPFVAAFAVVDFDHLLSDACTSDTLSLKAKGLYALDHSYCKVQVVNPSESPNAWIHVSHHFTRPMGDTPEGVVRMAGRYWEIKGFVPWNDEYKGRFLYNQGSNGAAGVPNVDLGFYDNRRTLDSLCLMYRANVNEPWKLVSRERTANSSINNGYFVARLFPGQYALAVVDTSMLSIDSPDPDAEKMQLKLFPNPSTCHEVRVELSGYDKKFNVIFHDNTGKKMLQMKDVHSGDVIRHNLPVGIYTVLIQNNLISLQSQIIVQ